MKVQFSVADTETKGFKPLKLIDEPADHSYCLRVAAYVAKLIEADEPLTKLDLSGARLEGMDFRGRDFTGCDLFGTNFMRCDLRDATFHGCRMLNVNLAGADVTGASFAGSDLRGAHIYGAIGFPKEIDVSFSPTPRMVPA